MLFYTTFVFDPSLNATNLCISFFAENNVCTTSYIFFGAGFPLLRSSRSPAAYSCSFVPTSSSNSGSHGVSDLIAITRVIIWFSSPGKMYTRVSGQNMFFNVHAKSKPATIFFERLQDPNDHSSQCHSQLGRFRFLSVSCIFRQF